MPVTALTITSATFDSVTNQFTINYSYTTNGGGANGATFNVTFAPGNLTLGPIAIPNQAGAGTFTNNTFTFTSVNENDFPTLDNLAVGSTFSLTPTAGSDFTGGATLSGLTNQTVTCFMPGTLIATPAGEVAVETLQAGDLVLLADGSAQPVRWVGRQTISTHFMRHALPIRIQAGALGGGLPKRDLLVSPAHAMFVDGILVHAEALVNGTTIRRETDVPQVFTYLHVELAEHALILAEGAATESFVDNVARGNFDNWAEHEVALGSAPVAEMDLPRAASARQVPAAIRARLAAVAAKLAPAAAAA